MATFPVETASFKETPFIDRIEDCLNSLEVLLAGGITRESFSNSIVRL
jgi:hypothetical protein